MFMRNNFHTERGTLPLQKLAEQDPAFASLSLFCKHRDSDVDKAIAWTDGKFIYYGPRFATLTLAEKVGVAAHEIMHIAFRHISRAKNLYKRFGGDYDPWTFNVATDAIINQTLLLAGYTLPRPCIILEELFDEVFSEKVKGEEVLSDWDAEKLYVRLINEKKKCPGGGGKSQGQGSAGANGSGKGQASNDGKGTGNGGKSIEELLREFAEKNGFTPDFDPDVKDGKEDAQEDTEWQRRLEAALNQGKTAGKGIGKIAGKLGDIPKSQTPWEILLRKVVSKAVTRRPRRSFERPTKTFLAMDADAVQRGTPRPAYQQGYVKNSKRPKVVVGVDVSGSISDRTKARFAGEIAGIGRRTGAEIHVMVFDTRVHSHTKMAGRNWEKEITEVQFLEGGGTCFVEVVDKAKELDPSIIVILTDLCGPFGNDPDIPVIWAIEEDKAPFEPPFGRVLSMAR